MVERARAIGLEAQVGDARALPFEDDSFDTVLLAETLEHLENPGLAWSEACRVARGRVIMTVPLFGWEDPTHRWRLSLDLCDDPTETRPTNGHEIVLTWQKGTCWPRDYWQNDDGWYQQFRNGR
jgi:hypothetical protein